MKYLAILKDSVREAIDNKVIFVMIGLSLLVTLFVFSLGFSPLPPDKMMARLLRGKLIDLRGLGQGGGVEVHEEAPPAPRPEGKRPDKQPGVAEPDKEAPKAPAEFGKFTVRGVELLKGAPDSPESSYRYTIALPLKDKEAADRARADPAAEVARLRGLLTKAEMMQYFKVTEVRPLREAPAGGQAEAWPHTAYFQVTTEPVEDSRLVWGHDYSLLWGAVPLGGGAPLGIVLFISTVSVLGIGSWVTLMVSIIITAFFIPNMLRKGTVDLLLVRPISRSALLTYKYVGGLTFIFVNTSVAIVGMWLALGVRSGVWANSFLLMIFVYTFFFAILYAVSALFAVLTRSAVVAILVTCGAWFVFFLVGLLYAIGEGNRMREEMAHVPPERRTSDNAFFRVMRGVHFVLPRTSDLNQLGNQALLYDFLPRQALIREGIRAQMEREPFNWTESIIVSLAFIAVMLGLSCWRFAIKDY
jgi:ABC-type transport system involved in multi-copper enzyme maturation permease subunit